MSACGSHRTLPGAAWPSWKSSLQESAAPFAGSQTRMLAKLGIKVFVLDDAEQIEGFLMKYEPP
jgi:hypothetical protein